MGARSNSPVNEAANLLSRQAPSLLASLRSSFPEIIDDLQPGMMAGDEDADADQQRRIVLAKGRLMIASLDQATHLCDTALPVVASKIRTSRKIRVIGQVVTAVASSGTIGAISASQNVLALISGFLSLTSSISTIVADHYSSTIGASSTNLNDAYERLVDASVKSANLAAVLRIQLEFGDVTPALERTIAEGNGVCEVVNRSVYALVEGLVHRGSPPSPAAVQSGVPH